MPWLFAVVTLVSVVPPTCLIQPNCPSAREIKIDPLSGSLSKGTSTAWAVPANDQARSGVATANAIPFRSLMLSLLSGFIPRHGGHTYAYPFKRVISKA